MNSEMQIGPTVLGGAVYMLHACPKNSGSRGSLKISGDEKFWVKRWKKPKTTKRKNKKQNEQTNKKNKTKQKTNKKQNKNKNKTKQNKNKNKTRTKQKTKQTKTRTKN